MELDLEPAYAAAVLPWGTAGVLLTVTAGLGGRARACSRRGPSSCPCAVLTSALFPRGRCPLSSGPPPGPGGALSPSPGDPAFPRGVLAGEGARASVVRALRLSRAASRALSALWPAGPASLLLSLSVMES